MVRKLMIGGIIAAALGLCAYSRAQAQDKIYYDPPSPGQVIRVPENVLCDEKQQVVDIGKAGHSSFQGLVAKYQEYAAAKDAKGEPVCAYQSVQSARAVEVEQIGVAWGGNGEQFMTYAVRIAGDDGNELWLLLPLKEKAAPKDDSI
jgi:hypothetical protein